MVMKGNLLVLRLLVSSRVVIKKCKVSDHPETNLKVSIDPFWVPKKFLAGTFHVKN